ncbi:flap endonuclease-1 [Candidatus Woesearchaeota archaeon]|nr:flap endonuclease-1 [Candidatus Woesearchaeota archaeon]
MGVAITELLVKKEIKIGDLKNRIIAVDAPNWLYQFLTTIRQRDGTPLMDSSGNITSHLVGLFSRTANLMDEGLKLVYVFDGKAPALKEEEREKRKQAKIEAEKKYNIAVEKEDIEEMKKYASRTSRLTGEMISEAKELITALGLPVVDAPSEGEAQAAHIAAKGNAYCSASQDADSLLFGATRLVRSLSVAGKRKKTNKLGYVTIQPELITLAETLNELGIDREQLIALAMLIGTDYNNGGIKGIGPKNALKLVKEYGKDFDKMFKDSKWADFFNVEWRVIFDLFKNMPVTDDYKLKWNAVDEEKIKEILAEKHNFSKERVESSLKSLIKKKEEKKQKGLGEFL